MPSSGSSSSPERAGLRVPPVLSRLVDLAYNFWWTWAREGHTLFKDIDPELWERCEHQPIRLLHEVPPLRLSQLAADPNFVRRVRKTVEAFDRYLLAGQTWTSRMLPQMQAQHPVAYFCAEFGIHESLPIYSGGLGVLAGDHLKSASDLGIPLVGVGLLYRQGYFRQRLNLQGWQEDYYVDLNVDHCSLERVCDASGEPLTVTVYMRQRYVKVSVWLARVGRIKLYLLDTHRSDNDPIDCWLTSHLYGGNQDTRIAQEIVLGIGGVRVLQALGIQPSVYHLNEGHAAFALLELCAHSIQTTGKPFAEVQEQVRRQCVFTTHTPVPAGHDVFAPDLMNQYFAHFWPNLKLTREQFMGLGQKYQKDPWEPFSMTVLALRLCRDTNGVSQIHGEVTRQMWASLYQESSHPQTSPLAIGSITNGIHTHTWMAPLMADLFDRYLEPDWGSRLADRGVWEGIARIPDEELWNCHQRLKELLIAFTRQRILQARRTRGEGWDRLQQVQHLMSPDVLTLGFARRFSTYKRGDLLLKDPERVLTLFNHPTRPIQIIFAGKSHPADDEGKRIIQRIMDWCRRSDLQNRVAFIEDYDLATGRMLVQGVDVWLNNPRRPLEASGTSGQKVCFNGGLNCSILDGWWPEGYNGRNGWAVGYDIASQNLEAQDLVDAESLYTTLEQKVIPLYYQRGGDGIPHDWIQWMKESIRTNSPLFNTDRMVAEYTLKYYAYSQPSLLEESPNRLQPTGSPS